MEGYFDMDNTLLAGLFGLIGSIIGGLASFYGSKSAAKSSIEAQNKLIQERNVHEESEALKKISINARIIFFDLITALHEGLMVYKEVKRPGVGVAPMMLPMYGNYSNSIAIISDKLVSEELILLNKLYGAIEKIRHDILNANLVEDDFYKIRVDYLLLISEVYGDRYGEMLGLDIGMITEHRLLMELRDNYKSLFTKLIKISARENN